MKTGIEINRQKPDEGKMRGTQEAAACGVWFTSTGNTMPKLIKFKDSEGVIHQIGNITVASAEKKYYCGIPTMVYLCTTVTGEREWSFKLYYYIEESRWKIQML